jgi:hypothetical protein
MKLTINLVTRGRPERLLNTVERTLPLLGEASTQFVISVDDDDTETLKALDSKLKPNGPGPPWIWFDDPRVFVDIRQREDALGAKWDRALAYPADVYYPMADYTAYVTPAFDTKILEAASLFPDGIGVVYSRMCNFSFPRSQGATHGLVQKLGYMYPPYFPYWFVDHWLDDIAKMIDRISFADIETETGHKPGTQEQREVGFWATFFDSQRLVRRRAARAIIDSPDFLEPEWRKEILRRHHPLIEYRSQWINDQCRNGVYPAVLPGGPRYDRLKEQAAQMMAAEYPALTEELMIGAVAA